MSLIDDLREMSPWDWSFFFTLTVGIVSPGILAIWRFNPDLLLTIPTSKLLLLGAAITSPVIALNVEILEKAFPKKKIAFPVVLVIATGIVLIFFGIPLLVSLFFELDVRCFAGILIVLHVIYCGYLWRYQESLR